MTRETIYNLYIYEISYLVLMSLSPRYRHFFMQCHFYNTTNTAITESVFVKDYAIPAVSVWEN